MSKILRNSHKHILENLPDFVKEEYVFSGGTALAEYYFHHRLSDDIDFFGESKTTKISIDALQSALKLIGKTSYERTHGRAIFSTESRGEIIKIDFCPLYYDRLQEPKILQHGYFRRLLR